MKIASLDNWTDENTMDGLCVGIYHFEDTYPPYGCVYFSHPNFTRTPYGNFSIYSYDWQWDENAMVYFNPEPIDNVDFSCIPTTELFEFVDWALRDYFHRVFCENVENKMDEEGL